MAAGPSRPPSHDLRTLAAAGALLVAAGCAVGWFARAAAVSAAAPVTVVRPSGVLGLGVLAWVVLLPVLLAPLAPAAGRQVVGVALAAVLPAFVLVAVAFGAPRRDVVSDITVGETVGDRQIGQALTVVGLLVVVMALATAWQRVPDWRVPPTWWRADAPRA